MCAGNHKLQFIAFCFPSLLFALASCSIQNLNSWLFKVSDQWTLRKLEFRAWGWEHITLLVLITSWNYYANITMPDFRLLPLCSWDCVSGFCTVLIGSWFLMFQNSIQSHLQGSRCPSQGLCTGDWDHYVCWNISNELTHTVQQPRRAIIFMFIWLSNWCHYFCEFYFCDVYCIFLNIYLSWASLSHIDTNAMKEFKIPL